MALNGLGWAHALAAEPVLALDCFQRALRLRQALEDRRGEVLTLSAIGLIYNRLGQSAPALDHLRRALDLSRTLDSLQIQANPLSNLGWVHAALGDYDEARRYFEAALQICRSTGDRSGEANILYGLARAEMEQSQLDSAIGHIEASLEIIESLRERNNDLQLRSAYLALVQDQYQLYIELLMRRQRANSTAGDAGAALQVSERARARSLLDTLTEAGVNLRRGADSQLIAEEERLQKKLNTLSATQMRLLSGKHKAEQAAALAGEIKIIVSQLHEARAQIHVTSPRYAALTQPQPLTAEQIQRELLDDDTLLLEYSLGEERSYLWAVTPTSLASYELPKRAEIEAQAARVYELLTARNQRQPNETPRQAQARATRADAELPPQAAALSRMILGPAAAQLGKKRLLVVAQGKLQFIPFGALPEPETTPAHEQSAIRIQQGPQSAIPLIVHHEIVHLPSASTLAVLRQELTGRQSAAKTIALLADPVFEMDDERLRKTRSTTQPNAALPMPTSRSRDLLRAAEAFGEAGEQIHFRRLEDTGWEARQIARLAPPAQVFKAEGFAANHATAVSGDLSNYRIVHFASHSFLHSAHPELSGIVLSLLDERGREQDGFLRLHEIYNLKLPADLVVLSACQTGLGKEVKGEGLMSLTRGFMYAGAARVVVSAWSIEDRASATLMVKFYKHLLGKPTMSPAAALRAAQLELWRDREFAAPYFWAGFVLQGEWK